MDTTSPSPSPPETDIRMCPYCRSYSVVALGRVTASAYGVRSDYLCPTCAKEFVFRC